MAGEEQNSGEERREVRKGEEREEKTEGKRRRCGHIKQSRVALDSRE